ncbi:MAG: hypothetical protein ACXWLT_10570 [Rhizomicrobium sp.]
MRSVWQLILTVAIIGLATAPAIAAADPTGEGPPDRKSCRRSQAPIGSSISGPSVCLTNAQWLALHQKNKTMSEDGKHIIDAGSTPYYKVDHHFMTDDRDMTPRGGMGTP